jgi:DNA-binding MarR family transcriptional regulator
MVRSAKTAAAPRRTPAVAPRPKAGALRPGPDGGGPPPRAEKRPAPVAGTDAEVNRYIAAYIMGVANRLANGASNHYRKRFNMGMSEWRAMMAIGTSSHRIVREVAEMADLDYAAASKSLKLLQARGLVDIEQTNRRGRAAIASLTDRGLAVYRQLRESAQRRQRRLLATFTRQEVETLWSLLKRIEAQVPHMNAER